MRHSVRGNFVIGHHFVFALFREPHQAVISALGAKVTPGFDTKLKMVDFLLSTIFG